MEQGMDAADRFQPTRFVQFKGADGRRHMVRLDAEPGRVVLGVAVNMEGDEIVISHKKGKDGVFTTVVRSYLFGREQIVAEYRMSLKYARLMKLLDGKVVAS